MRATEGLTLSPNRGRIDRIVINMYEILRRWKVDEVGVLFDRDGGNEEFAGILVNPGERGPGP